MSSKKSNMLLIFPLWDNYFKKQLFKKDTRFVFFSELLQTILCGKQWFESLDMLFKSFSVFLIIFLITFNCVKNLFRVCSWIIWKKNNYLKSTHNLWCFQSSRVQAAKMHFYILSKYLTLYFALFWKLCINNSARKVFVHWSVLFLQLVYKKYHYVEKCFILRLNKYSALSNVYETSQFFKKV